MGRFIFLCLGILCCWSEMVEAYEPLSQQANFCPAPQTRFYKFYIDQKKVDFYTNFDWNQVITCVTRLIFVVHGTGRNALARFQTIVKAAESVNACEQTLIISPFFKTENDEPADDDYFFSNSGWKQGNTSNNAGTHISSFAVADRMMTEALTRGYFPNLRNVIVTGHSAGGQYTQRYALTSPLVEQYPNLKFKFAVLNPSSYTYLDGLRPHPTKIHRFDYPIFTIAGQAIMRPEYLAVAGLCADAYNDYKYGLERKNSYGNKTSNAKLIKNYLKRDVYYLLGSEDNDEYDDDLDKTCPAKLEGRTRLDRGVKYSDYLNIYYPQAQHTLEIIPEVDHNSDEMYNSPITTKILFDQPQRR
jgi:hypothetical protein